MEDVIWRISHGVAKDSVDICRTSGAHDHCLRKTTAFSRGYILSPLRGWDRTVPMNLVLASQSPRRKELLAILGHEFSVVPSLIDESPEPEEQPEQYVVRVARDKGAEVASRVSLSIVLSADTIVVVDDEILGKPADTDDAFRMLRKLSGREHSVYTAVTLINQQKQQTLEGLERTRVWFTNLDDDQIADYIRRENVYDKAGAYAIQGYAGIYIPKIEGNYFNVMGLPLPLVHELLCRTLS